MADKTRLETVDEIANEELHIVFDGPPGPVAGRFVEVEDAEGHGLSRGRWEQHGEFWHLVLPDKAAKAITDAPAHAPGGAAEDSPAVGNQD